MPAYAAGGLALGWLLSRLWREGAVARLATRFGPLVALLLAVLIESGLRIALRQRLAAELEGSDALLVTVVLPVLWALFANALYLGLGRAGVLGVLEGAMIFSERLLLCDVRLSLFPLGYVVVGEPWVYPLRVGCRVALVALALWILGRRGHKAHDRST